MLHFTEGAPGAVIDERRSGELLDRMLANLGPLQRALLIPPDITRFHSGAGELTVALCERLRGKTDFRVLPALGTHLAMTAEEKDRMYPGVPHDRFLVHDWRNQLVRLGEVPGDFVREVSEGKVDYSIDVLLARAIIEGGWDAVISIGQLVPHEVAGIANHNKNVLVGCGGPDFIHKSHFLGAVHGMERMMGRAETPVRRVFDYAERKFLGGIPLHYILTVRARIESGDVITRGLFAGDDAECFRVGAELCRSVNLAPLDRAPRKMVVHLDPHEYRSTWLGNKAIYRTRMAIADDGELVVLAPGVKEFGEDAAIDALIRRFGYKGTPATLAAVKEHADLRANLSAAAHLIHGSSEGRFRIRYAPGMLGQKEIEAAGYEHGEYAALIKRYDPSKLREGWNVMPDGEEIFFISAPGLGLWGTRERFGFADG
ncbi:MAG TPA: lactate racemase domain-containing protein [Planctomycetia bacterium]|nr:lactate racemase domain-containing protein [Planctomycetia bacterium]